MSQTADELFEEALLLPPELRLELAQRLLGSLNDEPEATVETAWAEELRGRLALIDREGWKGTDWATVRARLAAPGK